jgi:sortase A
MVIGITIMCYTLYIKFDSQKRQQRMIDAFINLQIDSEDGAGVEDTEKVAETEIQNTENILGILKLPKIDLEVPIIEGINPQNLKYAVGHFSETAGIGKKGNCAIAGHRSYTYNEYFNRLIEMEVGDQIIVNTKEKEFAYIVYEKKIVEPSEISVLDSTDDATITLVTCHPERSSSKRLVVKGRL